MSTNWVAQRIEEWRRRGSVELRASRARLGWALVGSVAFTLVGVGLIWVGVSSPDGLDPATLLISVVCIAFFGVLGIPALVWQLTHLGTLVLDREGVRHSSGLAVRWCDVEAVVVTPVSKTTMVALVMDPRAYAALRTATTGLNGRALGASTKILGGPLMVLPTTFASSRNLGELVGQIHHEALAGPRA